MSGTTKRRPAGKASAGDGALCLKLFDRLFPSPSWTAWKAALAAILGLPVEDEQARLILQCTARARSPKQIAREVWVICGRRAGKSQVAALLAVYFSCVVQYRRSPGERLIGMLLAADRKQAGVLKSYIAGLLHAVPELEQLIARELAESVELTSGITIEIHTSSFKSTRGYTCIFVIADEVAFWAGDNDSSNPAGEVIRALRPSLSTTNGLLICLTTPYAPEGPAYEAVQRHFGRTDDPVLVWMADTRTMNATIDPAVVDAAYLDDAEAAASEYGREGHITFRSDLSAPFDPAALRACSVPGRRELPPRPGVLYAFGADFAGGSGGDASVVTAAHKEPDGLIVLDFVREWRGRHDPAQVVAETAAIMRRYGGTVLWGDKYGAEWVVSACAQHGIAYVHIDENRSQLYAEMLPLVNAGQVQLLDHARLLGQFAGLQRRTGTSGRDNINHRPGGHDDVCNAAAIGLLAAARSSGRASLPATFTSCNRVASGLGLSSGDGVCYLYGGSGRPVSDVVCRNCEGNKAVQAALAAHRQRTGGEGSTADLLVFYRDRFELPPGAAYRALVRESEDALGFG
jgi:hypothetical protein